jgi:hypothetical protein
MDKRVVKTSKTAIKRQREAYPLSYFLKKIISMKVG